MFNMIMKQIRNLRAPKKVGTLKYYITSSILGREIESQKNISLEH